MKGFTILELLITLVFTLILISAGYFVLRSLTHFRNSFEENENTWTEINVIHSFLMQDLQSVQKISYENNQLIIERDFEQITYTEMTGNWERSPGNIGFDIDSSSLKINDQFHSFLVQFQTHQIELNLYSNMQAQCLMQNPKLP